MWIAPAPDTMAHMHRPFVLALLAGALLAAGCGDDTADTTSAPTPSSTVQSGSDTDGSVKDLDRAAAGIEGRSVCRFLPAAAVHRTLARAGLPPTPPLRARANDSLNLSICRYGHGDVNVRIIVDAAGHAGRRYFEQQAEMTQKFVRIPRLRPQLVEGVGDDEDWANAGAHWTPAFQQLVGQKDDRIVRVTINVAAPSNRALKRGAAALGREVFARLAREPR
jgi:hypothetical protein